MPKKQDCKKHDFSRYDALSTEELTEILRLDSETPEGNGLDIDTLLYITGVLAEREKPEITGKTAQEGWNAFRQNYLDYDEMCPAVVDEEKPVKSQKTWLHRIIAAAAALVLVFSIPLTVRALSWEEFYTAVVQWAKETFSFVVGDLWDVDGPNAENTRQYTSLQHALDEMDVPSDMVPTWIPEGYVLNKVEVDETPIQRNYIALYVKDEKLFNITIRYLIESDPQRIEANEDIVETFVVNGNKYFIMHNNERTKAVWTTDLYEYSISGELTIEEIKKMIESISEG